VPTLHALPYGTIIGPDKAVYFCEFGSNKIGKVDPKTLNITEIVLPDNGRGHRKSRTILMA
jgi:streptogramin lyase